MHKLVLFAAVALCYLCVVNTQEGYIPCHYSLTKSVASRAQINPKLSNVAGCSSDHLYLVLHAKLTTNFPASYANQIMCYDSVVTSESDSSIFLTSKICLNLVKDSYPDPTCVTMAEGYPAATTTYNVDPTKTKDTLIGSVVLDCSGYADKKCPDLKSMTWTIFPTTTMSPVPTISAQWQFSGAAYQVPSVDTSCIVNDQNCMGYPQSATKCLVQGPFGGTGSNFCGSNSGTGSMPCATYDDSLIIIKQSQGNNVADNTQYQTSDNQSSAGCTGTCMWIVIGAVAGFLVLALGVVLTVVLIRRKQNAENNLEINNNNNDNTNDAEKK